MTKEEAISILMDDAYFLYEDDSPYNRRAYDMAIEALKAQLSEEGTTFGQWIPVTERLPEDIKPVIVTWKNTDPKSYYQYIVGKHFTGTACYKNGKWYWYSSTTEDILAEYGRYDSEEFDEALSVSHGCHCQNLTRRRTGMTKEEVINAVDDLFAAFDAYTGHKTGRWIPTEPDELRFYQCSQCGTITYEKANYCSHCGSYNGGEQP